MNVLTVPNRAQRKEVNTRQASQGGARWMESAGHQAVLFE